MKSRPPGQYIACTSAVGEPLTFMADRAELDGLEIMDAKLFTARIRPDGSNTGKTVVGKAAQTRAGESSSLSALSLPTFPFDGWQSGVALSFYLLLMRLVV